MPVLSVVSHKFGQECPLLPDGRSRIVRRTSGTQLLGALAGVDRNLLGDLMQQLAEKSLPASVDFLPLNGTDYVEFYVGNARQAAYYYRAAFGMQLVAYSGPETGQRGRASYVVQQNKIRLVLTTPLPPDDPVNEPIHRHIQRHGDGVHDIALWVDDAEAAYRETTKRGAKGVRAPEVLRDDHGEVRVSAIATYGDTIHSFIERRNYSGVFLPGYSAVNVAD